MLKGCLEGSPTKNHPKRNDKMNKNSLIFSMKFNILVVSFIPNIQQSCQEVNKTVLKFKKKVLSIT